MHILNVLENTAPPLQYAETNSIHWAVPWLRRLIAGLSRRRSGFDPGSVHVGYVVDKMALGQVFLRVLRFPPVNFIPPVGKRKPLIICITGLHNKPQDCGASVASAAGPFTTKKKSFTESRRNLFQILTLNAKY
jgi:hypothetical protein